MRIYFTLSILHVQIMKALIVFLLLPLKLLSQDISGIWTGILHTEGNDLVYELVISENKEKTNGYSLTIFSIDGVENIGVKSVKLKKKNGNISVEDDELVYDNYTSRSTRAKLFALLSLSIKDSVMTLNGKFRTRSLDLRTSNNNSYTGTINLEKQQNSTETKLIDQLAKLNLLNTLSFRQPKIREKEKSPIVVIQPVKTQPTLSQQKEEKDSVALATINKPVVDLPKEEKKKTINSQTSIVKANPGKDSISLLSKTEQKQLIVTKEKEKRIDSNPEKTNQKNTQAPIVKEKPGKTSTPFVSIKEEKQPASLKDKGKEKAIDTAQKNEASVVKTTAPIPQPVLIKKDVFATPSAAAAITERKTEIIRNVFFSADSLVLSLYDNGTIIIAKKGLTANALRIVVQMTPDLGDSLLLTMYAENLGSIPPNTGLLIIQDGDTRNEIRFEGDTHKNSAIVLRRRR